jgi:hypothetical protein
MKKYLLGIFAIVLAVGFSAFTAPKKTSDQNPYYWYHVVGGETIGGPISVEEGKVTKDQALMDNYTTCIDSGADVCLFGSDIIDLDEETSVGSPSEEARVLFDE